jgi:hypothetical protein
MPTTLNLNDPRAISRVGTRIYEAKYKREYEAEYPNQFVAINVADESAAPVLGATAMEALTKAKQSYPTGFFHLIRIGHIGVFEVGMGHRHVDTDRLSR